MHLLRWCTKCSKILQLLVYSYLFICIIYSAAENARKIHSSVEYKAKDPPLDRLHSSSEFPKIFLLPIQQNLTPIVWISRILRFSIRIKYNTKGIFYRRLHRFSKSAKISLQNHTTSSSLTHRYLFDNINWQKEKAM